MLIKPYNQEIKDGLSDKLANNTVAFTCSVTKSNVPSEATAKAVAAFGAGRNFDLYYIQSILASIAANKNDDWFLPEEIWAARQTPVHKQLNYMHDEKNIIGVITDSILLNSAGEYVLTEENINSITDIATQAVIWTHWDDKKVESNISKIIASIEENKLFVSMEALFKKFDYMLVSSTGFAKIVARSEATAFLTKYLRCYGGSGEFDNHRVYRILRDFTFSGKGIVEDPANPRSIIGESFFDNSDDCSCCDDCDGTTELVDGVEFEDGEDSCECFDSAVAAVDKKVKLNKPFRTPGGPKKFSVYVKNDKGNVVKVNFGDPNMSIKRDNPERKKSFRARHNCDNPGPKWKARYWSCKFWSSTDVSKLVSTKAENIMEDVVQKEVAELKSALAKANETITSLKAQEADKATAEVADLKAQVKALKALAEETQAKMEETDKECAAKVDEMEKDCAEKMDKMEKETCSKLAEATAQLEKIKSEKIVAERTSKLVSANVPEDKAAEVVKTFASVSDDVFAEIAALYAVKAGTNEKTTVVTTDVKDAVDAAKTVAVVTATTNVTIDESAPEDSMVDLSKSLAIKLNFKTKGDK